MFLLDTNVLSELRKAGDGKADSNVIAWLDSVDAATLFLSAITLLEIELGILQIKRRDTAQGARLRTWMANHVLPEFLDGRCPLTLPWPFAANPFTCRTHERSAMP